MACAEKLLNKDFVRNDLKIRFVLHQRIELEFAPREPKLVVFANTIKKFESRLLTEKIERDPRRLVEFCLFVRAHQMSLMNFVILAVCLIWFGDSCFCNNQSSTDLNAPQLNSSRQLM